MHTHVDNYDGVKMFSPADVVYFMDMVRNASVYDGYAGRVCVVMIASNGTYQLEFTGNSRQIKTFTKADLKKLISDYMGIVKEGYEFI